MPMTQVAAAGRPHRSQHCMLFFVLLYKVLIAGCNLLESGCCPNVVHPGSWGGTFTHPFCRVAGAT